MAAAPQGGDGGTLRGDDAAVSPRGGAQVSLRPLRPDDEPLLMRLLADSRRAELDLLPWSEDQKQAFVRSQHAAQHAHLTGSWPEASLKIVLLDGEAVGRIYVHRQDQSIHLLEISLLAEHRGRGLGTALLESLISEADGAGAVLTANVERANRALGLYERLGFRRVAEHGLHLLMEWRQGTRSA